MTTSLIEYFYVYIWFAFTTFVNMFMTVSGSGIINPVTAVFTDPQRAIAIGGGIFFLSGLHRVYLFRKNILSDPKNIGYIKTMLPTSILGALIGGSIIATLNIKLVAAVVIVSSLFFIFKTIKTLLVKTEIKDSTSYKSDILVAILTGFFQGAGMPGVDMRNNYLRTVIPEVSVRAVSSVIGVSNFFVASAVIFIHTQMPASDFYFILSLIPVLIIVQVYGKKVLIKIPDKTAKLLAVSMSVVGVILVAYKYLL